MVVLVAAIGVDQYVSRKKKDQRTKVVGSEFRVEG
jgi:hypothetical protein